MRTYSPSNYYPQANYLIGGGLKNIWNVYNDALFTVDPDQAPAPSSTSSAVPSATPSPVGGSAPGKTRPLASL